MSIGAATLITASLTSAMSAQASVLPISAVQGTGSSSPFVGTSVTTSGFVTAAYPTGGLNGFVLQSAATGGTIDPASHPASDALFVFTGTSGVKVAIGDYVQVTGAVSEFAGLTELSPPGPAAIIPLNPSGVVPPTPTLIEFPATDTARETLEEMLVQPQGPYTVTGLQSTRIRCSLAVSRRASSCSMAETPPTGARPGGRVSISGVQTSFCRTLSRRPIRRPASL